MKNTKTTLMELTKQYRAVLMKCLICNVLFLSLSANADISPDENGIVTISQYETFSIKANQYYSYNNYPYNDPKEIKVLGQLTINHGDVIDSNNPLSTYYDYDPLYLKPQGKITVDGGILSLTDDAVINGTARGSNDKDNTQIIITNGGTFNVQNADLETNADIIIDKSSNLKVSCSTSDCRSTNKVIEFENDTEYQINKVLDGENNLLIFSNSSDSVQNPYLGMSEENRIKYDSKEIDGSGSITYTLKKGNALNLSKIVTDGDGKIIQQYNNHGNLMYDWQYMVNGNNLTIGDKNLALETKKTNVVLGDTSKEHDYAFLGANKDLTIQNSNVTLNKEATLSYNGTLEDDGAGSVKIDYSTLTLNDNSALFIGMESDQASQATKSTYATLTVNESIINIKGNSILGFYDLNPAGTTISNSTINMSDNSSMSLNDMVLNNKSKINMNDASSVVAEAVVLNDSYINMKDNSVLDVYNVTFDGGVIYSSDNSKVYIKDDRGANSLTLNGTTITTSIFSNSISNLVKFLGTVRFSGLFDPATAEVGDGTAETLLTKDNYDDEITYNLNNAGTLAYTKDSYLYDLTKHNGTYGKNTINFKGGTLDLRNGAATAIHLASLSLADGTTSSIYADVDLANEKMDTLTADNISVGTGAKLNIVGLNLISDAANEKTSIIFTENENLKDATAYTGETIGLKALSPVYTYDVAYNNGIFEFTRLGSGENSNDYNPAVYSSTTVSQNVGLLSSNINSIAFAGLSGENSSPQGRSGGDLPAMGNTWVKLVGFDENVDFDSFQTVDSQVFSVIGGMTTDKVNLGSSDMTFGAYAGYLNGKQKYTDNKVEQNGGYFGLSTSWTKDRLFVDGTINAGFIRNEAKHSFGTDKYNTYWTGAAAKVGYNYALTNTLSFVPSFYAGYTIVDTKDYTSVSGVRIENDKTHVFEFAPGLKLSQQFNNDWTGFIQGKYAILKNHGGDVTADDIALPNISTDNYAEYGIGLDKVLTDNWTLSLTANRRDGGRQGWNGSVEFKYNF